MSFRIYERGLPLLPVAPVQHVDEVVLHEKMQREPGAAPHTTRRRKARHAYEQTKQAEHRRRRVKLAAEIMSRPVTTVHPNTPVTRCLDILRQEHIRHLPIVAMAGLVGIVSERDLLRVAANMRPGISKISPVSGIMGTRVLTAEPETTIRDIARIMFAHRVGSMPIMEDSAIVGIITRSDILKVVTHDAPIELWS